MSDMSVKIGDRVRLSDVGMRRARKPDRRGVVLARSSIKAALKVKWDDARQPCHLHHTYLQIDEA